MAESMSEQGVPVEIASFDPPGAAWLSGASVPVHALGPTRGGYSFNGRWQPWLKARAATYGAVIVHGLWQYHGFGTRSSLQGTGVPYFVFPHGMLDPWFKHAYPGKHLKKCLYWPWGEYRVLRDAEAVIFTSEEERRLARESFPLYRSRERVANLGIKEPPGNPLRQREVFFERFPQLRDQRILLFLGRLHEKKGCDLLIRSFAEVAATDQRFSGSHATLHLVMAGPCADAGYLENLRQLAGSLCPRDSVSFPGMLTGDLKWGALQAAEVFVLPSHQENFGLAVVEALACGTPVLISNKVNIWREIEGQGGLVGKDDLAGTKFLLKHWLDLPLDQQTAMRAATRACFARHFEVGAAVRRLVTMIQSAGAVQSLPDSPPGDCCPRSSL